MKMARSLAHEPTRLWDESRTAPGAKPGAGREVPTTMPNLLLPTACSGVS
jgi:hypothetical protein